MEASQATCRTIDFRPPSLTLLLLVKFLYSGSAVGMPSHWNPHTLAVPTNRTCDLNALPRIPDDVYCDKYYVCGANRKYVGLFCPESMAFDFGHQECHPRQMVDCSKRPKFFFTEKSTPTTTASTAPTTVRPITAFTSITLAPTQQSAKIMALPFGGRVLIPAGTPIRLPPGTQIQLEGSSSGGHAHVHHHHSADGVISKAVALAEPVEGKEQQEMAGMISMADATSPTQGDEGEDDGVQAQADDGVGQ